MLPKKDRVAIYECLFIKGVMVARKNYEIPKHLELECVPNLEVIKSLKSKGYAKEQSTWRHFYWYLTNEGVKYLRGYLHVPPEIVPLTLKGQARLKATQARLEATRPRPATGARSETSRPMEDRAGYRRGLGGKPQ